MPLHYKTKEAAVKKYGRQTGDALRKAVEADANNYTAEEVDEILQAIAKVKEINSVLPEAIKAVTAGLPEAGVRTDADPNGAIREKLRSFDYENLRGKAFREYCLLVQTLNREHKYDFELYHVEVAKRERYRGVKDTPVDTVGFRIINSKPINTTRIPVKHALANNGLVIPFKDEDGNDMDGFETVGCQLDHNGKNGRYYLLKK